MFVDECTRLVEFGLAAYDKVSGVSLILTPAVPIITIFVLILVHGAEIVVNMTQQRPEYNTFALAAIFVPLTCHMLGLALFLLDCWGPIKAPFVRRFLRFGFAVAFAVLSFRAIQSYGLDHAQNSVGLPYGVLGCLSMVAMGCRLGYLKYRRTKGRRDLP
jgi:hypothetical protein